MRVLQRTAPEPPNITADGTRDGRERRLAYVAAGVFAIAAVVALLHQTAGAIVATWFSSETFNHGFLIIPICVYLAWQRREVVAAIAPAPDFRALVLVVLAALFWLSGYVTGTLVVQEFSLVILVQSVVLTMYGWPLFRALIFPLLYLFFAVPVGEALIPPLQAVTAHFAVTLLQFVGVPVYSDGNVISIPTGNFYVAEACAGARYLIGSLAIGVLFAGLMYRSWLRRGLFLAMSIVVPIIANGIRAFGIILIAYLTDNEFAVGVDHIIYGWLFFSLVTFLVLGVGATFREPENRPNPEIRDANGPRRSRSVANIVVAGLLALAPVAAATTYGGYAVTTQPAVAGLHLAASDIAGPDGRLDGIKDQSAPIFAGADAEAHVAYDVAGRTVYLHIGYYQSERRGASPVSFDHRLIGDGHWIVSASGTTDAMIGHEAISVQSMQLVQGNRGRTLWYWYWVDGKLTGNPYLAKLLQAKVKFFGGIRSSAIILAAADYGDVAAEGERSLQQFVARLDNLPAVLAAASAP